MLAAEPISIEVQLSSANSKKFNRQSSNYYAPWSQRHTHTLTSWSVTDTLEAGGVFKYEHLRSHKSSTVQSVSEPQLVTNAVFR